VAERHPTISENMECLRGGVLLELAVVVNR